jgi:UDP-N-acetyl-D-glucosamine dehydrogenase
MPEHDTMARRSRPDDRTGSMGRDSRVAVVGLGYVGLPLAVAFAEAGLDVEGIDISETRIATIRAGRSPIEDISDERLEAALTGPLRVSTQADAQLAGADAVFVCVPTPINTTKDPDLGPVLSAARFLRDHVRGGQLVVLQSTTYPGTTMGPFREILEENGLVAGRDFDLAYAPERVNPGDPASAAREVPRLVGGMTPEAGERAKALLSHVNDRVIAVSSPDAAEMAKLLENVFRNVNIAFVNQLALLCERMDLDVWEIIDAAATKPFGFMRFTPGPGVGGHCIPVDPYYLSWRAREFDFVDRFIELAGDINLAMPRHVVDLVAEALNDRGKAIRGAHVGVVGVAFKPNVQDDRNSPAAEVIAGIAGRGGDVRFHDPHVASFRDADGVIRDGVDLPSLLEWADVIVVVTGHRAIDWAGLYATAGLVVDTVNSSDGHQLADRQVLRLGAGWTGAKANPERPARR